MAVEAVARGWSDPARAGTWRVAQTPTAKAAAIAAHSQMAAATSRQTSVDVRAMVVTRA
jgi:hypothetical protein